MKALIVIDVQKALFEKKQPVFQANLLLTNINRLFRKAAAAGASIYVVQHANDSFLQENSIGWQNHPALQIPPDSTSIFKRHPSCFKQTPLVELLASKGEKELVIAGMVTNGCVKASCLDGLERGYAITLVQDAHSTFNAEAKKLIPEWNARMAAAGATLLPAAEVAFD